MIKMRKVMALAVAGAMAMTSMAYAEAATEGENAAAGVTLEDANGGEAKGNIVYATSTFGQKFSPFFATTAYDMEVVDLTQVGANVI